MYARVTGLVDASGLPVATPITMSVDACRVHNLRSLTRTVVLGCRYFPSCQMFLFFVE